MSLAAAVKQDPSSFELLQIVRILHHSAAQGRLSFAVSALPNDNLSQVQGIEQNGQQLTVSVAIEALTGAKSVLPDYFYQQLLMSLHQDNCALLDFVNIFNHRYYQLYLAEQQSNHLLLRQEYEEFEGRKLTRFSQRAALNALSGLNATDQAFLPYSILLGQKSASIAVLQQILSDYFALKVTVKAQMSSHHLLPRNMLSQLSGRSIKNNKLGRGLCLGKSCTLQAKSLEIMVWVDSRENYLKLTADEQFVGTLKRLVNHYLREAPPLKLFLNVQRRLLRAPQLLSNSTQSLRLGESSCLAPERKPDALHKILLQ